MELGITIPLQKHLKRKPPEYGQEKNPFFCWDLHVIILQGEPSLLSVNAASRYCFVVHKMSRTDWNDLTVVFSHYMVKSLLDIGLTKRNIDLYFEKAGHPVITKTHGRIEVAHLNRAWEDVIALEFLTDPSLQQQPQLDHTVNDKLCRCAGQNGTGTSLDRMLFEFTSNYVHIL